MKLVSKEYTGNQLMNPQRVYVHSTKTNIAETFRRIREEQAKEAASNVRQLKRQK